jgi:hypothetical protein
MNNLNVQEIFDAVNVILFGRIKINYYIMSDILDRARFLIAGYRARPAMYASTKEAYLCIICTIMEMTEVDFKMQSFYNAHLQSNGSIWKDIHDPMHDKSEWAHKVCDDAIARLDIKSKLI